MAEANRFLRKVYLPDHDGRFATPSKVDGSAFVHFVGALDVVLCVHEECAVSNDDTVRGTQLPAVRHRYVRAMIQVHEHPDRAPVLAGFHDPGAAPTTKPTGS